MPAVVKVYTIEVQAIAKGGLASAFLSSKFVTKIQIYMFLEICLNITKAHRVCSLCTNITLCSPLPYNTHFTANNFFFQLELIKKADQKRMHMKFYP